MQLVETTETRAVPIGEKFMLTIKEAAPYYTFALKQKGPGNGRAPFA